MIPRLGLPGCLTVAMLVLPHGFPATVCSAAVQATWHVAPDGNDRNPGTEARPFATIGKAQQAVRAVNQAMTGDIEVILHAGTYAIDRTILFEPEDSGTGGHKVS